MNEYQYNVSQYDVRTVHGAFGDFVSGDTERGDVIEVEVIKTPGKPEVWVRCNSQALGRRSILNLTNLLPNKPSWRSPEPDTGDPGDVSYADWDDYVNRLLIEMEKIAEMGGRRLSIVGAEVNKEETE
jgi:hypothetical protein